MKQDVVEVQDNNTIDIDHKIYNPKGEMNHAPHQSTIRGKQQSMELLSDGGSNKRRKVSLTSTRATAPSLGQSAIYNKLREGSFDFYPTNEFMDMECPACYLYTLSLISPPMSLHPCQLGNRINAFSNNCRPSFFRRDLWMIVPLICICYVIPTDIPGFANAPSLVYTNNHMSLKLFTTPIFHIPMSITAPFVMSIEL